jgi:hypothetical protein
MNLSGNPEHREAYVLSAEPPRTRPGDGQPSRRARQASWRASRWSGPRNPPTTSCAATPGGLRAACRGV